MATDSSSPSGGSGCGCEFVFAVIILFFCFVLYMGWTGGTIQQNRECYTVRIPPVVNLDTCSPKPTPAAKSVSTPSF